MANIISAQTGNFTSASTWQTVEATSELDSEAGSTAISTSNLDSSTFVLTAVALDGVALKLAARATSPSGTFTVTLRNSTTSTDVKSVTVNVSDIPASGLGWIFFKFASSHTPNGTDSYLIRVVCSTTGSQVTLYRNATSNNWSRKIRTTTTQAPASGNQIVVSNQFLSAGSSTAVTITMDNTATTSFGPTVSGGPPQGIVVSGNATVTLGTASSTAYYLKWKGIFLICGGGTVNLASSGARLPISSSCVFEMDSASNTDSGLAVEVGGTFNAYGATTTSTTVLTADAAAAATSLTVGSTAGWQASDTIIIAKSSTGGTESKSISSVTDSTHVAVSALAGAHSAAAPIPAEVINLTRNIKIRGISTSLNGYVYAGTTATVNCSYVELYQLGGSSGSPKFGITIFTTTGSALFEYCGVHDNTTGSVQCHAFYVTGTGINNFTISGCAIYNIFQCAVRIDNATTGTNWSVINNVAINCSTNGNDVGYRIKDLGGTFTGNTCVGSASDGFFFDEFVNGATAGQYGTISGLMARVCSGKGINFNTVLANISIGAITSANNGSDGVFLNQPIDSVTFTNLIVFGHGGNVNFRFNGNAQNVSFSGGVNTNCTNGIGFSSNVNLAILTFYNVSFDLTSGVYSSVNTNGFINVSGSYIDLNATLNKCLWNPTNMFSTGNPFVPLGGGTTLIWGYHGSYVAFQDFNQVAGDHRYYTPIYTTKADSVIFNVAAPSERITPNHATIKSSSAVRQYPVDSGNTKTITVQIRKSVVGDAGGVAYAGSAPRLILKQSNALGITADTVLATSVAANGVWESLSGTTSAAAEDGAFEVYVDCDGTSGAWVNVDDWS